MTQHADLFQRLTRAVTTPTKGVLGLVEELLEAARERPFRLNWHEGRGRILFLDDPDEQLEVPLPKSVVRAILARVALLCNEERPDSVSPYGGRGEVGAVRVIFVNTPEEQQLELAPPEAAGVNGNDPTARTRTPSCSAAPR